VYDPNISEDEEAMRRAYPIRPAAPEEAGGSNQPRPIVMGPANLVDAYEDWRGAANQVTGAWEAFNQGPTPVQQPPQEMGAMARLIGAQHDFYNTTASALEQCVAKLEETRRKIVDCATRLGVQL
jgi:hypothetical protein